MSDRTELESEEMLEEAIDHAESLGMMEYPAIEWYSVTKVFRLGIG
jgi:hypothetical protein